jgi:RimJ/RimL family protein N-acetyltransferase
VTIETERLRLRPFSMTDLVPLARLQRDPEMMQYMGDGHVHGEEETAVWLRWNVDLWEVDGYSVFAADLKPDMKLVGWVGVTKPHWFPTMMPTPEIGWFIDKQYWGQGLAPEGALAVLDFAFNEVGIDRVIGIYNAHNTKSGRVMEKIGMTFWQEVPHPQHGFPLRIFEIVG